MTSDQRPQTPIPARLGLVRASVIMAMGVLMALPALRGEFVGGDDHRLVVNHVLVNQPSFAHALELFRIAHRDLYQPLPLVSFQCEFAVGRWLGLFRNGANAGAWLFHLDNLLLHGFNAVLVGLLVLTIARLRIRHKSVPSNYIQNALLAATVAGILFATHPFQAEVASWINGRMMLLSTLFALGAALVFLRYEEGGRIRWAILALVCAILSCLSKVRAPLPFLLIIVTVAAGFKLNRRFYATWVPVCLVVAGFVVVNLQTTADAALFAGGSEKLHGSRAVRVLLALGFYFQHLVYPVGLCSYYPTPTVASWLSPQTLFAVAIVFAFALMLGWVAWRFPTCRFAIAWCAFAIGDTLPFFPARNVLAADRYMYLPMVGVAWCIAEIIVRQVGSHAHAANDEARFAKRSLLARMLGYAVVVTFIATGWRIADAYTTPLKKTLRTATLFPNTPRVWQRVGWCYERSGNHELAIQAARRELKHDDANVQSGALQLWGMALIHEGKVKRGLSKLYEAVERDPGSSEPKQKLGMAFDELGRFKEALPYYEQAVADAPGDNPTLKRLAMLYRRFGRLDEARVRYEQVLRNNPFDPEAVIGLTELDIERATTESYNDAETRLTKLLRDLPGNPRLIANRDMVRFLATGADDNMKTASKAFIALTDGRYTTAAKRVEAISGVGQSMHEARAWLRRAIGQLSTDRPDEPWTYGLITRILIADGESQLARVSLDLFQKQCTTTVCVEQARRLGEMISTQK